MYIRTIAYDINPAMLEQFRGEADGARKEFARVDGLRHHYTGVTGGCHCLSISIWDSAEAAEDGREQATAVLTGLARYLTSAPQITEYPVAEMGK